MKLPQEDFESIIETMRELYASHEDIENIQIHAQGKTTGFIIECGEAERPVNDGRVVH